MELQLSNADCLDFMVKIPDASIDLILADLPYGITAAKWDSEIPLDKLWLEYNRIATSDAAVVLFASQPFTSKLINSNMSNFKYCWYWEKEKGTGFLNAKKQPLRCIEEICVFYNKTCTYNPIMEPLDKPYTHKLPTKKSQLMNSMASTEQADKIYKTYTHSYPKNLLKFPRDNSNKGVHSTQKPLALVKYLLATYSNEGDTVLDNVMGSGTTGVACKALNRNFIGIELDQSMFEIARNRIEQF